MKFESELNFIPMNVVELVGEGSLTTSVHSLLIMLNASLIDQISFRTTTELVLEISKLANLMCKFFNPIKTSEKLWGSGWSEISASTWFIFLFKSEISCPKSRGEISLLAKC